MEFKFVGCLSATNLNCFIEQKGSLSAPFNLR